MGSKSVACRACGRGWADHRDELANGTVVTIRRVELLSSDQRAPIKRSLRFEVVIFPPGCDVTAPIPFFRVWHVEAICRMNRGIETPEFLPGPRFGDCSEDPDPE